MWLPEKRKNENVCAGAATAAGAFASGLAEAQSGPSEPQQDGDAGGGPGKGGWNAAPQWLQRLVQREPSAQVRSPVARFSEHLAARISVLCSQNS
jgi:hypothetical protein